MKLPQIIAEITNLTSKNTIAGIALTALFVMGAAILGIDKLASASDVKFVLYIALDTAILVFAVWAINRLHKHKE